MNMTMQFDAVAENVAGDKWLSRWHRSWPEYRQWFVQRNGHNGPSRAQCESALQQYMPELVPTWNSLCKLTGDDDLAAQFLSTWCPPAYLGGCSLAAKSDTRNTRLVRNYDLSPDLNEGLLLRTEWGGTAVMGMIEFLWGLSDGINEQGLAIALAFGGSKNVGEGFGITTILRYILQTCHSVEQGLKVLGRVPSHMAYNIVLADADGCVAVAELKPGGGMSIRNLAVSTNHQHGSDAPDKAVFTQTYERLAHLEKMLISDVQACKLADEFLKPPLFQDKYAGSMGTLFTADYDPAGTSLNLRWHSEQWSQSLDNFTERTTNITFDTTQNASFQSPRPDHAWLDQLKPLTQYVANESAFDSWMTQALAGNVNWAGFSDAFKNSRE